MDTKVADGAEVEAELVHSVNVQFMATAFSAKNIGIGQWAGVGFRVYNFFNCYLKLKQKLIGFQAYN